MKLKTYLTAGLLTLGAPLAAQAGVALDFNTQGAAGIIEIDGFDWAQNSFLAKGGTEAIVARAAVGTGNDCGTACDFTVYTHGTLTATTLDGSPNWSPLIDGAEITFTLQFTETVTAATLDGTSSTVSLEAVRDGAVRFEMYYDNGDGTSANALTGAGYSDGTLILFGDDMSDTPLSSGTFTTIETTPVALDGAGTDDYPGQLTVGGSGAQTPIDVGNLTQDNSFFLTQLAAFGFNFTNLSFNNPFTNVSPSDCFSESTNSAANIGLASGDTGCANNHVDGLFEDNEGDASATTWVPRTGSVNGSPLQGTFGNVACISGDQGLICPDFVAQTDVNSGVQVEVPEPGTLAITGLGLLLLGFGRRRNRA